MNNYQKIKHDNKQILKRVNGKEDCDYEKYILITSLKTLSINIDVENALKKVTLINKKL